MDSSDEQDWLTAERDKPTKRQCACYSEDPTEPHPLDVMPLGEELWAERSEKAGSLPIDLHRVPVVPAGFFRRSRS